MKRKMETDEKQYIYKKEPSNLKMPSTDQDLTDIILQIHTSKTPVCPLSFLVFPTSEMIILSHLDNLFWTSNVITK